LQNTDTAAGKFNLSLKNTKLLLLLMRCLPGQPQLLVMLCLQANHNCSHCIAYQANCNTWLVCWKVLQGSCH
jgi:hypothetical protein